MPVRDRGEEYLEIPKDGGQDFELQLLKVLEDQNPWDALMTIEEWPVEERLKAYDSLVPMVAMSGGAVRPQAEQDALITLLRRVFKVAASTVKKDVTAYLESTRGLSGGHLIAPYIEGEGWMAEAVYRPDAATPGERFKFAYHAEGAVSYVDTVEWQGNVYTPPHSRLVELGTILLPSAADPYQDEHALFLAVRSFIHKYVDIPRPFLTLCAYYVMLTWVYDRFTAVPYLRAIGDYGSGKTRLIQVTGSVSYRGIMAGGATTSSPVFRLLDRYKGTLVVDEADFGQSDMYADLIKILNTGYMVGFPVLRSERNGTDDGWEPTAYFTYGPKILATRGEFKDKALESRMFTHTMNGSPMRANVPLLLSKSFWVEACALRNQLLLWRFQHATSVELDPYERIAGVEPRLNQIILPMKSVMSSPAAKKTFDELIQEYQVHMREDRGLTLEAMLARAVLDLKRARRPLHLDAVRERVKEEDPTLDLGLPRLGSLVRRVLGLPVKRLHGQTTVLCTDEDTIRLKTKYSLE
jgi:hypothetical protein